MIHQIFKSRYALVNYPSAIPKALATLIGDFRLAKMFAQGHGTLMDCIAHGRYLTNSI